MGAVSSPNRVKMLSLVAILVLSAALSVEGRKCQKGGDSLCFIAASPNLKLNECCPGFECTELEGEDGDKFCMEKDATPIAEGESCKGFSRNCEKGLRCKKNCKKGEKCKERICIVPLALGEDCKLPEGGLSRNCGKGLKCSKKEGVCVEKKKNGKGKGKGKGKGNNGKGKDKGKNSEN